MEKVISPFQLKKPIPELFRLMTEASGLPKSLQDINIWNLGGIFSRIVKELGPDEANIFLFNILGLGIFMEKNKLYIPIKKTKIKKERPSYT